VNEWQRFKPKKCHLVLRELKSPTGSCLPNIAQSKWANPVLGKIKSKPLELFEETMKMNTGRWYRILCRQLQAQVVHAVRMNRVRLKELTDAWRFLFFRLRHPYRGEDARNRFDK
jgi:hypothetical protein